MGLLSSWKEYKKNRKEKLIAKKTKTVKNAKAIKEDRVAAIDYLKSINDCEKAVPALLQRFEYSLEHGINDTREKESAMEGILAYEDAAIPLVKDYLRQTSKIAWPIKILEKLTSQEEVAKELIELLNFGDVAFDQAIVDRNFDILCYLADYELNGVAEKIAHFTNDVDERVRSASVNFLVRQQDPEVPDLIEKFLADESSENRRLRMTVVDAFIERGWKVKNTEVFEEPLIVEGVFIRKDGILERRN